MSRTPLRDPRKPFGVTDLMAVTGWSRPTCYAAMESGVAPGYRSRPGGKWTIPAQAFHAFCAGKWKPQPRQVVITSTAPTLLHTVNRKAS